MGQEGAEREILGHFDRLISGPPVQFVLDEGGRLTIPAALRPWFPEKKAKLCLPKDKRHLKLYPPDKWEEWVDNFEEQAETLADLEYIWEQLQRSARECNVDSNWRVVILEEERRAAGIEKEVILVGEGISLGIWNPERWTAREAELDQDARLDELKNLQRPRKGAG